MDAIKTETKASQKSTIKVEKNTKLKLNGKAVTIHAPIITDDGTTLLPVRAISELLNIQTEYNTVQKVVMIQSGETLIEIPLGYSFGIVNGEKKEMQDHKKAISYKKNTYFKPSNGMEYFNKQ